jgi:hypothetical protein
MKVPALVTINSNRIDFVLHLTKHAWIVPNPIFAVWIFGDIAAIIGFPPISLVTEAHLEVLFNRSASLKIQLKETEKGAPKPGS